MKIRKSFIFIILTLITILGIFLRFNNLSSFKFYPDSYQNLIVAKNLSTYNKVVGYLGTEGMLYPDFFMWTRPMYPLLINIFKNPLLISFFLGVMAIPLAYFLCSKFFKSNAAGLWGSALTSLSFNHTVWSGYVMTETTGVFFMLLFLCLLFTLKKPSHKILETNDLIMGGIFSIAVFTRYEYAILLIPTVLYILLAHKKPQILLLNFFISFISICAIFLSLFYSPFEMANTLFAQSQSLLKLSALFLFIFIPIVFLHIKGHLIGPNHIKRTNYFLLFLGIFAIFYSFIQPTIQQMHFSTPFILSGLKDAAWQDFLIFVFFITGTYLMIKRQFSSQILVILLSIFILSIIYYRVNFDMFRYFTHLLPFMIIPASYGVYRIFISIFTPFFLKNKKKSYTKLISTFFKVSFGFTLVLLFITQFFVSLQGIKSWQQGAYHRVSYEEISSKKLNEFIKDDDLLLVSLPEVYYYFTGNSTHSITDTEPYLYIRREFDKRTVVVVMDMGMDKYFPSFTKVISDRLSDKQQTSYFVNENFLVGNESIEESQPISIYKLTVGELKRRLDNNSQ